MSAHTPGDWRVWSWTQRDTDGSIVACGDQVVSRMQDGSEVGIFTTAMEGESLADLHLIAAAPDLLAALQGLDEAYCRAGSPLSRSERHEDRMRLIAARAAIAKATGAAL